MEQDQLFSELMSGLRADRVPMPTNNIEDGGSSELG
jgi:hypothetical protein